MTTARSIKPWKHAASSFRAAVAERRRGSEERRCRITRPKAISRFRRWCLVLWRVELGGVFGGDQRHWFLGRIGQRCHDRFAIVAFPCKEDRVFLGIEYGDV